jgi:phosphoribosylamine--glycine ligase
MSYACSIATIVPSQETVKVLVIGSGGREHALVWKLSHSPYVSEIYAAPGNPGIAAHATCLPRTDYLAIAQEYGIDLTVVGPEAPLVAGVVDTFRAAGLNIVGPTAECAQLEGSKLYSKRFMERVGIQRLRSPPSRQIRKRKKS